MRTIRIIIGLVVAALVLVACGEDNSSTEPINKPIPSPRPTATHAPVTTPTEVITDLTYYSPRDFDLDGDGEFAPSEIKPAVGGMAQQVEFAPGYEFDNTRFGLGIDRVLNTGWRTWSLDYPDTVIVPAQTCSWLHYWSESVEAGDADSATIALEKTQQLAGQQTELGDLAGPVDSMIEAAEAGDTELVNAIFTQANCDMTFFVPSSLGPQG